LIGAIGVVLAAIAAVATVGALLYQRKSYALQERLAKPRPNVVIYLRTRGEKLTEPVIMWQQPRNADTSPRAFAVVASNAGSAATGRYRLSLYAPSGITFATGYASAAIPGLQLESKATVIDGHEYSEAYFDSSDGLQISNTPQALCQGAVAGKCGTFSSILWRFRSDGYEAEGKTRVQLN